MNFYHCILFCIGITYVRKAYKEDTQHLEKCNWRYANSKVQIQ